MIEGRAARRSIGQVHTSGAPHNHQDFQYKASHCWLQCNGILSRFDFLDPLPFKALRSFETSEITHTTPQTHSTGPHSFWISFLKTNSFSPGQEIACIAQVGVRQHLRKDWSTGLRPSSTHAPTISLKITLDITFTHAPCNSRQCISYYSVPISRTWFICSSQSWNSTINWLHHQR
jgi:hypothetical protein